MKRVVSSFTIVNREDFLRTALAPYVPFARVEEAVVKGVDKADISCAVLDRIAQQRIHKYSTQAGTGSFVTSSFGGIFMLPIDYAQFFVNSALLLQELFYLYGAGSHVKISSKEDVEVLFYMLMGSSATIKGCGSALSAFSKYLLKKTGKKTLMKAVPAVGGIASSSFTYTSLQTIAKEFIQQLKQMKEEHGEEEPLMQQIESFIDVEYKEAEAALKQFCNLEKLKELREYVEAGYLSDEEYHQLKQQLMAE